MLRPGLNSRDGVADFRVEQSPVGEGRSIGSSIWDDGCLARCFGTCDNGRRLGRVG